LYGLTWHHEHVGRQQTRPLLRGIWAHPLNGVYRIQMLIIIICFCHAMVLVLIKLTLMHLRRTFKDSNGNIYFSKNNPGANTEKHLREVPFWTSHSHTRTIRSWEDDFNKCPIGIQVRRSVKQCLLSGCSALSTLYLSDSVASTHILHHSCKL